MAPPLVTAADKVVVGLDFGTTFSGVAYALKAEGAESAKVHVLKSWPGGMNATSDKVPTVLCYKGSGAVKWGFEVTNADNSLRCIKLLLDGRQEFPSWVDRDELMRTLRQRGKSAVDVATDYLTKLHNFTVAELGKRFSGVKLGFTEIEYVLTVPAIWEDAAKEATLEAAKRSGMGKNVKMISEPEAAAIETLMSADLDNIAVDDVFVVVDCGGGTTDIICYQVKSLSPVRFQEVVPGQGGLCGGNFVNFGFERLLRSRLGNDRTDQIQQNQPETWNTAMGLFENQVKRNFGARVEGDDDDDDDDDEDAIRIGFPGVEDNTAAGIALGFLTLSKEEMQEIFDPVINDVLALIEAQRNAAISVGKVPKAIILVGGFGQSQYLYQAVEERFCTGSETSSLVKMPLMVLRSPDAWTAVVRGAVRHGLSQVSLVTSRKARYHYGVVVDRPFEEGVHLEQDRYWDSFDSEFRASGQMDWLIGKGDDIQAGVPILQTYYVKTTEKPQSNETKLYICVLERTPTRLADGGIYSLCEVAPDFGAAPEDSFKLVRKRQESRWQHDFQLGIHVDSGRLWFDYRIGGLVYGEVDAKFD